MSNATQASSRVRRAALLAAVALVGASGAQATVIYWGGGTATPAASVDANSATAANMSGTWDATTLNWNLDSTLATGYQAWAEGNTPYFKLTAATAGTATVQLAGDYSIAGLTSYISGATTNLYNLTSTDTTVRTLTLGAGSVITHQIGNGGNVLTIGSTVNLAGSNGFTYSGQNTSGAASGGATMRILSASPVSGNVLIKSGTLSLGSSAAEGGSLANVQQIKVAPGASLLGYTNTTNLLKDDAEVVLGASALRLRTLTTGATASETIGKISIVGAGSVNTLNAAALTGMLTLNLQNGISGVGSTAKGMLFTTADGNSTGGLGVAGGVNITGVADSDFLPWGVNYGKGVNFVTPANTGTTSSTRFLRTDGAGRLGIVDSTTVDKTNLGNWTTYSATTDYHMEGTPTFGTTAFTGNVAMRSLAVSGATSAIDMGGNQLTTEAIAYVGTNGANLSIGTTATGGTLTAPAGKDLYLFHNRPGAATGQLNIRASITGNMDVIVGGANSDVHISGANAYTGKTYITGSGNGVSLDSTGSLNTSSEINIAQGALLTNSLNGRTIGGGTAMVLSGNGTYQSANVATTFSNVTIAPGDVSPGAKGTAGTLTFNTGGAGSTQKETISSTSTVRIDAGPNGDRIATTTLLNTWAGTSWTLDIIPMADMQAGVAYPVFTNSSTTTTNFRPGTVTLNGGPALVAGTDYTWAKSGNDFTISLVAVPEPGMLGVVAGVMGLVGLLRRRMA